MAIPLAALASVLISTLASTPKSSRIDLTPSPIELPLTIPSYSASPDDKAITV